MPGVTAAFFDLDRTLIPHNSGASWVRREVRAGRLTRRQAAEAGLWFAAYRFGLLDVAPAFRKAAMAMRGQDEEEMRERTRVWWEEEIRETMLTEGIAAVEEHRRQGHRLILLTSSSPYVSQLASNQLALHAFLCTRFGVKEGKFTGEVEMPVCYGEGKVTWARAYAEEEGVDLASSYFYTDSYTDLPMLLAVGEPRVVNPDPRLKREARKRGWVVADWGMGGKGMPEAKKEPATGG